MSWKVVFSDAAVNTALAASAVEAIKSSDADIHQFGQFNFLQVFNRDSVDVTIDLDNAGTAKSKFTAYANSLTEIVPEENILFSFFTNENSATRAQTAGKIEFKWGRVEGA